MHMAMTLLLEALEVHVGIQNARSCTEIAADFNAGMPATERLSESQVEGNLQALEHRGRVVSYERGGTRWYLRK